MEYPLNNCHCNRRKIPSWLYIEKNGKTIRKNVTNQRHRTLTFSRWKKAESGHLPESSVPFIMLAKTLNVSLDWLFYLDEVGSDLTPEETELIEQVQQILKKKGKKKPAKKV